MDEMEIEDVFADEPQFDGLPQYTEYSFDEEQLDGFQQLSMVSELVHDFSSGLQCGRALKRGRRGKKRRRENKECVCVCVLIVGAL